jgi:hypothetical protein
MVETIRRGTDGERPVGGRLLRATTAILLLAAIFGGACRTAPKRQPVPEVVREPLPPPAWIQQPLSWEKLEAIEAWLEGPGYQYGHRIVVEGILQLNEGRVYFTTKDLEGGTLPHDTLVVRARSAAAGFGQVLDDPEADLVQKQRAETGQRAALALLDEGPATAGLVIIPRSAWGAKPANPARMTPLRGSWSRITVHHSAEGSSDPNGASLSDSKRTVRLIQKYHTEDPGHLWGDIGYHFLIDSSGRIFEGRELRWQGAHAGGANGANNRQNIGICMLGNFESASPRTEALTSLTLLLDDLRDQYGIPASRVYPHSNFGGTACPGQPLTRFLKKYRE